MRAANWTEEQYADFLKSKKPPAEQMSEADLMWKVRRLATLQNWKTYHTHDSRRSEAGFPDLVFVRGSRMLCVELKSEDGKLRKEQTEWLAALRDIPTIETYVWRPSQWLSGEINNLLA